MLKQKTRSRSLLLKAVSAVLLLIAARYLLCNFYYVARLGSIAGADCVEFDHYATFDGKFSWVDWPTGEAPRLFYYGVSGWTVGMGCLTLGCVIAVLSVKRKKDLATSNGFCSLPSVPLTHAF